METPIQRGMRDIITQPISDYVEFNSIKGYIAVTWGNQRYVINAKKEADYVTGKIPGRLTTPESEFILYNPEIHDTGLLQDTYEKIIGRDGVLKQGKKLKNLPSNWNTWGRETTVSPSAKIVNSATAKDTIVKKTAEIKTTVTNQLLGK
jgi:hypothetical protein